MPSQAARAIRARGTASAITRISTPAKPTSRPPASSDRVVEGSAHAAVVVVIARHQQAHVDDRVVGPQPQVAQLGAQAVDLARHQVELLPDRLHLLVGGGLLEAAQQAAPLRARGLEPVLGGHVLSRHVAALLALADHRSQLGQVAQRRAQAIAGDAQREVAAAVLAPRVDRRVEHEAAVPVGDRGDLIGHARHVVERHVQLEREGALDLAVGSGRAKPGTAGEERSSGGAASVAGARSRAASSPRRRRSRRRPVLERPPPPPPRRRRHSPTGRRRK